MVFRWFRQNKASTRWIYIILTVFVMVTFTVTGAMIQGLRSEGGDVLAGRFTLPSGDVVEVKQVDFARMRQLLSRVQPQDPEDEDVWSFLMVDALADEAGIRVSDDMVADALRLYGFKSNDEYREFLRMRRLSAFDFQDLLRRQIRQGIYAGLVAEAPRVDSAAIYDRFRTENELFRVRYVAFDDEDAAAEIDATTPDEETLRAFYADTIDPTLEEKEFSTPARYAIDAAILPVAGADAEALAQLLPEDQRTVGDAEVESYYRRYQERFRKPEPPAEEATEPAEPTGEGEVAPADEPEATGESAAPAEAGAEGAAGGDAAAQEEAAAAEEDPYLPLAEARDQIVREILVGRVIGAAAREHFDLKRARDAEEAAQDEKAATDAEEGTEAEAPEDETAPAEDEAATETPDADAEPADAPRPDLLAQVAEKYHLELVDLGEPRTAEELAATERLPGDDLTRRLPSMLEGDVSPFFPTDENTAGVLVRLEKKIAPEPLPFEEVRDRLVDAWRDHEKRERARRAAQEFRDALTSAARERAADEIAAIEAEARATAEKRIADEAVTDEAKKQEIVDQELAGVKPSIDAIVSARAGELFDEVAAERGLQVEEVGPFRKSYRRTAFWRDDEATVAKFLKGYMPLFSLPQGAVTEPLHDPATGTHVVATIAERKDPTWDEMRLGDRYEAETALNNDMEMQLWQQGRHPRVQFSFPTLASQLNLQRTQASS